METFLAVFISTFIVMILAEFGDKTNLIALSLMTKSHRPYFIAFFSTLGITLSTIFSVLVGTFLGSVLPMTIIRYGTAIIFILLGVLAFFEREEVEEEELDDNEADSVEDEEVPWYKPVYLVALAEFGDKSQIFVISASASTFPVAIFFGATLGMAVIMFSTAVFGVLFFEKIDEDILENVAAMLFIIAGLWIGLSTYFG